MNDALISRSEVNKLGATCLAKRNENGQLEAIISLDHAPTVNIKSCRECPFVADEEKQITNGDAWKSYCEGQEVGFKKAEDVFERMKLIQETVYCIRNTFNLDTESDKLVRNCVALVQNAVDGEYHDMEEVDVSELERPEGKWIPVSKQLPDKYDSYLVMWRSLTEGYPDRLFYEICEYVPEEDEWERIDQAGEAGAEIIAWMPLPKPYKEGEEK